MTVIRLGDYVKGRGRVWVCRCACGAESQKEESQLVSGRAKYCSRRCPFWHRRRHGGAYRSEYNIWTGMKRRCNNPNADDYDRYGGRGIRVCDRWMQSFVNFFADMGPRPTPDHSLDRYPDNNGDYEPGNCRWATRKEQGRNKRNNVVLTIGGRTQTFVEWCEEVGVNTDAMRSRVVSHGTTAEEEIRRVLTTGETNLVPYSDPESLSRALADVAAGGSIRSASTRYGIARSTIQKHFCRGLAAHQPATASS